MFRTDLLSVRRDRRKKSVTPIYVDQRGREYASMVRDLFTRHKGQRKYTIHDSIKELELKVEYNKIIKGMAEIMFRECTFSSGGDLDPAEVRENVFLAAPGGAPGYQDRARILSAVAEKMGTTLVNVEYSLYGDKEDDQELVDVPAISDERLSGLYNQEQAETLLMKSSSVRVSMPGRWHDLGLIAKSLGLFYTAEVEGGMIKALRIEGPLAVAENSRKYASRFSMLLEKLLRRDNWELNAEVTLAQDKKKEDFTFTLSSEESGFFPEYAPEAVENAPPWLQTGGEIVLNGFAFFPDYSLPRNGKNVYIEISRPEYTAFNSLMRIEFEKAGIELVVVYLVEQGQKRPRGEVCYSGGIDFGDLRRRLMHPGEKAPKATVDRVEIEEPVKPRPARVQREELKRVLPGEKKDSAEVPEEIAEKVHKLWPDTEEMIDLLQSSGFQADKALQSIGYTTRWEGLNLRIVRKNFY